MHGHAWQAHAWQARDMVIDALLLCCNKLIATDKHCSVSGGSCWAHVTEFMSIAFF